MSRQLRIKGQFVKKSKSDKIIRIRNAFSNFDSARNPKSINRFNAEEETRRTPPTSENVHVDNDIIDNGRRIVELGHIAKQLYCEDCGKPIPLQNTVNEQKYGYGSVLMIECECGSCREVLLYP